MSRSEESAWVVHSVACLDPETGGPARTVPAIVRAIEATGAPVSLVTQRPRQRDIVPTLPVHVVFARRGRFLGAPSFRRVLQSEVGFRRAALLHDHGIWLPSNHASAEVARRLGVPRIVSPRGMLEAWSLQWHGWRKRLAWRVYQRRDLVEAIAIHATSSAEAGALRAAGLSQPIVIIPNGVGIPPMAPVRSSRSPRVALFLSRLHPKKGLTDLVDAWAKVRPVDWELWIAGPDEDGHQGEVRMRAASRGIAASVKFLGAVYSEQRARAFERAELFVLPTRSENFGLVVAEALAEGLPVLTTTGAPWGSIVAERCGWWVPVGPEGLEWGLRQATSTSSEALRGMGGRGYDFARRTFGWPEIGLRMRRAYDAILGGTACADIHVGSAFPADHR